MHYTKNDLIRITREKFKEGQAVKIKVFTVDGIKELSRYGVKIIKFYPHHVLCHNGKYNECHSYHDMAQAVGER